MLAEENSAPLFPPLKRLKSLAKTTTATTANSKPRALSKPKPKAQKALTQLHFNIDQSILRTCKLCDLSYTKGAPDDEALHRAHCSRVRQGMEWGREEEKDRMRGAENVIRELKTDVKLKGSKKKGRVICLPADVGGKLGAKLTTLFQTINISLSSPELPLSALQCSKAYLFLLPHETLPYRERIVGCVIAQRISTAMAVVPMPLPSNESTCVTEAATPIPVDAATNLFCSPTPLPTPMGISRLFVSSSHRRLGIARTLLDAAAATFIHGCPLDSCNGQVAFSQPTGMGQAVMKSWGKGGVRVFEE
ncbi:hypothetical protein GALMADRAFT_73748 [Galerina marginata CBS 339.88]|uniref:N-acetyltransferase domain-containing protein n=1 Tax=Galerina marginata (strain CBS 339.88) TaxID=685588 RepID=A0A067SR92_GALM3|nr:hypothetical protein GALMADRAFT_73748 [Galerina marginata CBS 339.88]